VLRFTRDGNPSSELWVCHSEKADLRKQTPRGTGVGGDYYSPRMPDGTRDTKLETAFSMVERRAVVLFERVENQVALLNAERSECADFLAIRKLRVPQYEDECNTSP